MAALTFKVGGDTTGLGRAVSRAKGMLSGLGSAARNLAIGGAAAGVAGLTASFVGLKSALELGGRLSDVASNTGLLAGEALILERALSDAGISGEKLQATIQKMQKSIVEAGDGLMTPKRALDELGLSLEDLEKLSPAGQFAAIQSALAGLTDPAERSARAMQIFGRSGGELGALFSNPDAMKNAAESVGIQADILTQSADSFDRSADLLSGMGDKLRSFFVGMADYINPILLPVLEEMNKIDLAKIGAGFGEAVMVVVEAFRQDKLGELVKQSLLYAGKSFINNLLEGVVMIGTVFIETIKGVGAMIKEIFSMENLKAGAQVLGAGATGLLNRAADMNLPGAVGQGLKLIPKEWRDDWQASMDEAGREGSRHIYGMGDRLSKTLEDRLRMARESVLANAETMSRADLAGVGESQAIMADIVNGLKESVKAMREAGEESEGAGKKVVLPEMEEAVKMGARESVMRPILTSLGRLGGDGLRGGRTEIQMNQERNHLLKRIELNTAGGSLARYA